MEMLTAAGYRTASIVVVTVNIHIIINLMSSGTTAIWKCCEVSPSSRLIIQHFFFFTYSLFFHDGVLVPFLPKPSTVISLLSGIKAACKFVKAMGHNHM